MAAPQPTGAAWLGFPASLARGCSSMLSTKSAAAPQGTWVGCWHSDPSSPRWELPTPSTLALLRGVKGQDTGTAGPAACVLLSAEGSMPKAGCQESCPLPRASPWLSGWQPSGRSQQLWMSSGLERGRSEAQGDSELSSEGASCKQPQTPPTQCARPVPGPASQAAAQANHDCAAVGKGHGGCRDRDAKTSPTGVRTKARYRTRCVYGEPALVHKKTTNTTAKHNSLGPALWCSGESYGLQ